MNKCGQKCEVYSRVSGYHRPVERWNKGKQQEFKERVVFTEDLSFQSNFATVGLPNLKKPTVQKTLGDEPVAN